MSDSGGIENHQGRGFVDGGEEEAGVPTKKKGVYGKYEEKISRERLGKLLAKHPKFGQPGALEGDRVPTYQELICAIIQKQSDVRMEKNLKQNPPASLVVDILAEELESIAKCTSLRQAKRRKEIKIEISYADGILSSWVKNRKVSEKQENSLNQPVRIFLKAKEDHLVLEVRQRDLVKEQEALLLERDQLEIRVLHLERKDKENNDPQLAKRNHTSNISDKVMQPPHLTSNEDDLSGSSQEPSSQGSTSSHSQEWWKTPPPVTTVFKLFGSKTLKNTAETLDRFQLPPHQAAQLINAFQVDTGQVREGFRDRLIDPHKLERDRERVRKEKIEQQRGKVVTGLGIDGRKDKTLTKETIADDVGAKVLVRCVKKKTDNVSVISSPDLEFIGHFIPESGSGSHNKDSLCELLDQRGVIFRPTLQVVNLDGTSTNTGPEEGMAAHIEEELGRALQRSICFLHHLDRPFLHLLLSLDGRSLGPESFSGPIGKLITSEVHLLPVVKFEAIPVEEVK